MTRLELFYIILVVAAGLVCLSGQFDEYDPRRYVVMVLAGFAIGAAAVAYGIHIHGALQ